MSASGSGTGRDPGVGGRLFRGYGPLIGFALLIAIVANFLPTQRQTVKTVQSADSSSQVQVQGATEETSTTEATGGTETTVAVAGAGTAGAASGSTGTTLKKATANPSKVASAGKGGSSDAAAGRVACADRTQQVPGDSYSPKCYQWAGGSNGGATSVGVTGDTITVAVRIDAFLNGLNDALSKAAGAADLAETPETVERTFNGLADYFNKNYQFYGRKLKLVFFSGKGDPLQESLGGGQEGAQADALKVASDIKAFADVSAVTPPYADALSKKGVVNVGAPYVSRKWLTDRRPYAWTPLTDGTTVAEATVSYLINKMAGKNADWAGGNLKGTPRKAGIVAPENDWYQDSVNAGIAIAKQAGVDNQIVDNEPYQLDINKMSNTAATLVPKLLSKGVTTVICACDPVLLSFLTKKAAEQNWFPEWLEVGVALTDQDLVGQLFEPSEWKHAFGVSYSGPPEPLTSSFAYRAYKSAGGQGSPSIATSIIYYQLQVLAIGLQMAGPNLNPNTFEAGMFAYPPATGPAGLWNFGPGDYSTSADAREIYWDPNATSIQNGKKGAWIEAQPGKRYPIGKFPAGDPNVPKQ